MFRRWFQLKLWEQKSIALAGLPLLLRCSQILRNSFRQTEGLLECIDSRCISLEPASKNVPGVVGIKGQISVDLTRFTVDIEV